MKAVAPIVVVACCSIGCAIMKPSQADEATHAASAKISDPEAWRAVRPTAGPLPELVPPSVDRFTLANGIAVYVAENHATPLVHVRVVSRAGGAAAVGAEQSGLPNFVVQAMGAGSQSHPAPRLEDELARLGAKLRTQTEAEWSALSLDVLRENLPQGIELLSGLVSAPAFDHAGLEVVRARVIGQIDDRQSDSKGFALDELQSLIYDHRPLGMPLLGTRKTVERLTAADAADFYRRGWQPANVAVIVAGDVTPQVARELLSLRLARWTTAPTPGTQPSPAVTQGSPPRRLVLVDQPAAAQSTICVGFPTVPRGAAEWAAIDVVNRVLGGGYASRINLNIREDKGYSYNVRSALSENRSAGLLYIRGTIVIDKTVPAITEVLKELDRLRSQPPSDAELRAGRAAAIAMATQLETNVQVGDAVTRAFVFALPLDYVARYVHEVQSLTRERALDAAAAFFSAARASIVVLGPALRLREGLSSAQLGQVEPR